MGKFTQQLVATEEGKQILEDALVEYEGRFGLWPDAKIIEQIAEDIVDPITPPSVAHVVTISLMFWAVIAAVGVYVVATLIQGIAMALP